MEPLQHTFDAIIVGSGPAGATIARELSKKKQRVLILERGENRPLEEGMRTFASVLGAVRVTDDILTASAFTTGGTTSVYFGVADAPPLDLFRSLGIDLSAELEEARRELPLAELPDALLGAQALRVRDSAEALGYAWKKNVMLVDLAKCPAGYTYESKWNARTYLEEAIANGATLVTRARATKVLVEENRAVGVEYRVARGRKKFDVKEAFGGRVIVAAGAAASPRLLRNSGLANIGKRGFYCHPTFGLFGLVSGLHAGPNFSGSMGVELEDGIGLGDASAGPKFHRMFMLGHRRFIRAFQHAKTIGVGVMIHDGLGGELREDGRYHKELTSDDRARLEKGERLAREILEHAGGKSIFKSTLSSAHIGGAVRLNEDVDENLQTEVRNLHVCDGSIVPEDAKVAPALTLICLGKYLAGRLAQTH